MTIAVKGKRNDMEINTMIDELVNLIQDIYTLVMFLYLLPANILNPIFEIMKLDFGEMMIAGAFIVHSMLISGMWIIKVRANSKILMVAGGNRIHGMIPFLGSCEIYASYWSKAAAVFKMALDVIHLPAAFILFALMTKLVILDEPPFPVIPVLSMPGILVLISEMIMNTKLAETAGIENRRWKIFPVVFLLFVAAIFVGSVIRWDLFGNCIFFDGGILPICCFVFPTVLRRNNIAQRMIRNSRK